MLSPSKPEVVCHTDRECIDESAAKVLVAILERQHALCAYRYKGMTNR